MGDHRVIDCTTRTIIRVLADRFDVVAGTGAVSVQAASPAGFDPLAGVETPTISVMLHRIAPNAELRNAPQRVLADGRVARQPLPLELLYTISAWGVRTDTSATRDAAAALEEQRLLGLVAQTLYDHAELSGPALFEVPPTRVWADGDSIQLMLESDVDEAIRIWDSGENRYRLSLVYRARVVGIDSAVSSSASRVREASVGVGSR